MTIETNLTNYHIRLMHILPNLPQSVALEVYAMLCDALPTPRIDTPEARAARLDTAMAAVAALHPADACEALFATQIIGANAHALDCLRDAARPGQPPEEVRRSRAQAATMMRHMQSGLRMLRRDQALREKLEAEMHPPTMERAGWWFRDASVPEPSPAEPAAAQPPEPPRPAFSDLSEAEQYALIYPDRAALIRANGGLPPRCDFGPPEPELVEALVHGSTPLLRALDRLPDAGAVA
jgi:hypothetical protein